MLITGLYLLAMLTASALTVRAGQLSHIDDQNAQNSNESVGNRNPGIETSSARELTGPAGLVLAQTPRFSPFITTPSVKRPEKPMNVIRIGRLELIQKDEQKPQADGRISHPFDPFETVRAAEGLFPKPPITVSFDIKWRER